MILSWYAALAADIHQCTLKIEGPGGNSQQVTGFGHDEAAASQSARQAARILAEARVLEHGIQAYYLGTIEAQGPLLRVLDHKGSKELAVAGWSMEPDGCTTSTVEDGSSYTASWEVGSEEVRRPSPATALEVARRRACLPMLQRNLMQAVDTVMKDESQLGKLSTLDGTWNEFAACWTRDAPHPAPNPDAYPDVAGASRCSAIDGQGEVVAVGFGSSLEDAAEHAIRQGALVRMHRAMHELADIALHKPAEEERAAMHPALRRLVGLAGASDAVDRTRLACAAVTPGPIRWLVQGRQQKACNAASWTERPKTTVEPKDAATFLDGTCTMQISPTFEIVRFAGRAAEPQKKSEMVTSAFNVTGACAASCYRQTVWGAVGDPLQLHGAPDRTSQRAVISSLTPLVEGKSLTGLELLPTLQDPEALGALLSGELSTKLKGEVRALPSKPDRWKQIDGNWILLP